MLKVNFSEDHSHVFGASMSAAARLPTFLSFTSRQEAPLGHGIRQLRGNCKPKLPVSAVFTGTSR